MTRTTCVGVISGFLAATLATSTGVSAQDAGTPNRETLEDAHPERPYSPYAGGAVPTRVFWGETHLHTSFSMDAGAMGARLATEDAYRFARGEEIQSSTAGPTLDPKDRLPFGTRRRSRRNASDPYHEGL